MTEKKKKATAPKPAARPRKKIEKSKGEIKEGTILPSAGPVIAHPKKAPKVKTSKEPQFYGTGRRKEAIAKVRLVKGSGEILVNGKAFSDYFCHRKSLEFQVARPLHVAEVRQIYNVSAEAFGGGIASHADAVSLGIARALLQINPDFRSKLKKAGLLSRDPRIKERKKYGLKRARRAFQYTKR